MFFAYWVFEILSVLFALATSLVFMHWGYGIFDGNISVIDQWWGMLSRSHEIFGQSIQLTSFLLFLVTVVTSIMAAGAAKRLGSHEYQQLNDRYHKWFVVGTNGAMFIALGAAMVGLSNYWHLVGLMWAIAFYVFWKVKPHSFSARAKSVLLIRMPIGLVIGAAPPHTHVTLIIIGVTLGAVLNAVMHLKNEQKKYGWPDR